MEYNEEQVQAMLDAVYKEEEARKKEELSSLKNRIEFLEKAYASIQVMNDALSEALQSAQKRADFYREWLMEERK